MDDLILIKPSKELEKEIWEYRQEYFDYGEKYVNGSCGITAFENFDTWLEIVLSVEKERLRNGVHASTFFSVRKSDHKLIGSIQLRHSLTEELAQHGGHIGYGVRPTERKKGYGRQQLILILAAAKEMGLQKVLIFCDKDNTASACTAISCGGVPAGESYYQGKEQLAFEIDTVK